MSKPVKSMIVAEYRKRFTGVEGAVLVEIRGLDAAATNKMRNDFARKSVKVAVVKNALAREAFKGHALEPLAPHFAGPSAVVYSQDSVIDLARDLVKRAKDVEKFVFKAAILEGVVYEGPAANLRPVSPQNLVDPVHEQGERPVARFSPELHGGESHHVPP